MQTFIHALVLQAVLLGGEAPKLKVVATIVPEKARPGDRVELQVDCEIAPGWHIYPPEYTGTGMPTRLDLQPGALSLGGKLAFPEPRKGRDNELNEDTLYFEGKVRFTQPLLIPRTASPGTAKVAGKLSFQVCTESKCLPGETPVTAEVEVLADVPAGTEAPAPTAGIPDLDPGADKKTRTVGPAFTIEVEPAQIASGGEGAVVVRYKVPRGSHIYATDHKAETGIPTEIVFDEKIAKPSAQPAMKPPPKVESFLGQKHRILEKDGEIRVRFALQKLPAGKVKLPVSVKYQLCDDKSCRDGEYKGTVDLDVVEGAAVPVPAAQPGKGPPGGKTAFKVSLDPAKPTPGEKATLIIGYEVPAGGHLYAPGEDSTLATRIEVDPRFASVDGPPTFSASRTIKEDGQDRRVLEGTGEIRQPILIAKDAPPEGGILVVTISQPDAAGVIEEVKLTLLLKFSFGWLAFIILAIASGGVSVLMPCTYPMIPITISYFTRQAQARGSSPVSLALAYGAGIVGVFTIIGIFMGLFGSQFLDFTKDWKTNAAVAFLFLAFGLSLLGLFEIRLPASFNNLASRAAGGTGYAGVFLLGATVVITSFACTGPFIGGVIAGGAGNGFPGVVAGMFFFGLTMAVPFVALALAPGAVKSLPKSGDWLHTLKVSLGFVVLAAALPYISKVDKLLQWKALPRELYLLILSGIVLAMALHLFGMIRLKGESGEIGPMRLVIALLVLLLSLYCFFGAQGNPLSGAIETFAPDYSAERNRGGGGAASAAKAPTWTIVRDDFEGGLKKAAAEGKRAFINWTGETCTNCKKMELTVFTRTEISRELEKYVELRLHVDRPDEVSLGLKAIKEKRLDGENTTPIYEIVDPATQKTIDLFKDADLSGVEFLKFLARNAK